MQYKSPIALKYLQFLFVLKGIRCILDTIRQIRFGKTIATQLTMNINAKIRGITITEKQPNLNQINMFKDKNKTCNYFYVYFY